MIEKIIIHSELKGTVSTKVKAKQVLTKNTLKKAYVKVDFVHFKIDKYIYKTHLKTPQYLRLSVVG